VKRLPERHAEREHREARDETDSPATRNGTALASPPLPPRRPWNGRAHGR